MKLSESFHQRSDLKISRAQVGVLLTILISSGAIASERWNAIGEQRRRVQWVVDGDTFKVCPNADNQCSRREQISIRIKGLECPESSQNACNNKPDADCSKWIPRGKKAKKTAINTLKNKNVTLIPTGQGGSFESGGYNRPLAYVKMPNGSDYGLIMIEEGLCQDFSHRYSHPRERQYKAAQRRAGVFPVKQKERRRR